MITMIKEKEFKTTKIWNKTHKSLKILSAFKSRPMIEIIDDLVQREFKHELQRSQDID
jgi:hypothetical protein